MKCQSGVNESKCQEKAVLLVVAMGGNGWTGMYCPKHAGWIIKRRWRLIKRGNQVVLTRPIVPTDIMRRKDKSRAKRKRVPSTR